jgi:HlyD family secretion protein
MTVPRKDMIRWFMLTLCAAAILGGGMGCRRSEATEQKAKEAAQTKLATQVFVTAARVAPISETVEVTGALTSLHDVMVSVKVSGKMLAVYAREGDRVRAGAVLAQQDTTDLQSQIDAQRANLATAQSRLEQARVLFQNAQTTLKWTDEQTRSAVRQAQAGLAAAKEQLDILKSGARPQEIQQAQDNVAAAKADRDKARADLKRYRDLYRDQAVSAQQLDQAQAITDAAEARYNSAVQALSLVKEGPRQQDIRRAEAAVEQANQALVAAQSNRMQVNLRRIDVENARVGIQTAEAGVRQAQAALRIAEQALRDASIRSPLDGVVAERKVEPGMQVSTVKPDVMRIVDLQNIYFDAQLAETQYSRVQIGQSVDVFVDALPGRTFPGKVTKVYPVASPAGRSFTVRINLSNTDDQLRPQMFARGQITLKRRNRSIVIPREAVLDLKEGSGKVFVAVNNVAEERTVKVGLQTVTDAEILSGLQEGDKVITTGQSQIQKGDSIEVASAAGTTG